MVELYYVVPRESKVEKTCEVKIRTSKFLNVYFFLLFYVLLALCIQFGYASKSTRNVGSIMNAQMGKAL